MNDTEGLDTKNRPIVKICAICQKINEPNMREFAEDVPSQVKLELKRVDLQVKAKRDKISFTHGTCIPHLYATLRQISGMTVERMTSMVEKSKAINPPTCLITDDNTRKAYMNGWFTNDSVKEQSQLNEDCKDRFKILAGLKSAL